MRKVKITGAIFEQIWPDKSATEYLIKETKSEVVGPGVSIASAEATVHLYPESWPAIRNQINEMFAQIEREKKEIVTDEKQEPAQ